MTYLKLREAKQVLGLHGNTLRRMADDGIIPSIKTPGGKRLFDIDTYLKRNESIKTICYCRVSSYKQRDDLERQSENLKKKFPEAEIIKDIGSGLNFKRKGLCSLLERLLQGDKLKVVVANRDRLARFGFGLIEFLISKNGGELLVLNPGDGTPESELTQDLLAILHHFSCRMHQSKKDSNISNSSSKEHIQEMVRSLKESL